MWRGHAGGLIPAMMRSIRPSVHGLLARLALAAGVLATAAAAPAPVCAGEAAATSLLVRAAAPAPAVLFRSVLDPARAPLADLVEDGGPADSTAAAPASSAVLAAAADSSRAPALHAAPMPSLVGPLAGGLVAGAAGLYAGALVGVGLSPHHGDEWDDLGAALAGALLGEILMLPLGVHLGNGRRGSYGADLGVSTIGAIGGIGLLGITGGSTAGLALGATFQLAITTAQERSSARKRAARAAAAAP